MLFHFFTNLGPRRYMIGGRIDGAGCDHQLELKTSKNNKVYTDIIMPQRKAFELYEDDFPALIPKKRILQMFTLQMCKFFFGGGGDVWMCGL